MVNFMEWFNKDVGAAIPVMTVTLALIFGGLWTALTFFQKIWADNEQKKFERYRLLIQELNDGKDGIKTYIDYQLDAIYELRFHPKYYERSLWMLNRLKDKWTESDVDKDKKKYNKGHLVEIDETIDYISKRKTLLARIFVFLVCSFWIFHFKNYSRDKYRKSLPS